jgi:small subunit ribosomal protein S16
LAAVIRLRREGGKNQPHYRLVVTDSRKSRDGRFIEKLGHYDPVRGQKAAVVDGDRARYWLQQGARPSETVGQIFKKLGI